MIPWVPDDLIASANARFHDAGECDVEARVVPQFETESGTLGTFHTGLLYPDGTVYPDPDPSTDSLAPTIVVS